jgi:hypothetical protein
LGLGQQRTARGRGGMGFEPAPEKATHENIDAKYNYFTNENE